MFPTGPTREATALWESVLDSLASRLSSRTRAAIAESTCALELRAGTLRVCARATELSGWIGAGHLALLQHGLESLSEGAHPLALTPVSSDRKLAVDPYLEPGSFIVSPANAPTRDQIREFLRSPSPREPLWIHGPSRAGKTHALGVLAAAFQRRGADNVLLLGGEQLSMDLVNAIWNDDVQALRRHLAGASALLIDDVDQLTGKDATQKELECTLEALAERPCPVVLTSTKPPGEVPGLSAPLRRRASLAIAAPLVVPEWETRVAIVLDRIQRWNVRTVPEVASLLASRVRANLDRLDVLLTQVMGQALGGGELLDVELVRRVLDGSGRGAIGVSADEIIALVVRHFDVRLKDLRSASRSPRLTLPRQIAIYLIRRHCGLSYPEIGRRFGRHHTTAIHSDRRVQQQLQEQGGLRSAVVLLEKELLRLSERRS